ncbi:endonuclease III [Cryptobacterium curtum]|uniref:endonuclease III n=1 Tax=Cryptobacterium curtum TaxID=84163 RepID=UPI0028D04C51|nr:endonuclease III [Cryptobacterium curtum]
MPRETMAAKRERAAEIEKRMFDHYGAGACSLDYECDPFRLLVAVVLSAQCTDAAVNKVTPSLFAAYPTPAALAQANVTDVATIIHSLGFFRAKATHLVQLSQVLMTDFGGEVPNDIDALQTLPGVGRKTANVVMCEAFKNPQGIAVDTHVFRIAHKLKFAGPSADTPAKTEAALLKTYPQEDWLYINHQWVHFGREFCIARRPRCADCFIADLCPSASKDVLWTN